MIEANETFNDTFPFAPHFSDAAGFKMHYVDEGHGDPLLCLHGEPTWGYLYRHVIGPLSRQHRVIVPDYMGFGKSETPQDREYMPKDHVDNLEKLILNLDLKNITLVLHDWGGLIGGALALRHPDRISRLVIMNTATSFTTPMDDPLWVENNKVSAWFSWWTEAYANGTMEATFRNAGVTVVGMMKMLQGFERPADDMFFRAYSEPFSTPEECEGVFSFPRSIVTGTYQVELGTPEAMAAVRAKPATFIMGMKDKVLLPEYFIPMFERDFPGAPVHKLENASHFLLEDEPERITDIILSFIRKTATTESLAA